MAGEVSPTQTLTDYQARRLGVIQGGAYFKASGRRRAAPARQSQDPPDPVLALGGPPLAAGRSLRPVWRASPPRRLVPAPSPGR